jgi:FolB domain-containing protein
VDYASIFRLIEAHCTQNSFNLLEQAGQQLCDRIFDQFPVESIKLRIRKLNPFSSRLSAVGIELKRNRKRNKKRSR